MMHLLAESLPEGDFTLKLFVTVSAVLNVWLVAKQIKGGTEKREITGQPIMFHMQERFVERASFHKHAELNRKEHEKMSTTMAAEIAKIAIQLNSIAREVSDLNARSEINSQTLVHLDSKVDNIRSFSPRLPL